MPSFNSKFSGGGGAVRATTITADDLEIDSGTLSIDETNNRVGMGTTAPGTQLQVESNTPYVTLKNDTSENSDSGCESKLIFEDHANVSLGQIEVSHSGASDDTKGKMILSTHTGSSLTAAITINEAQKVTAAGDVQVTGDIILDDGGSLKEAGGTAAITFDGSGHVTKIGQDSPSSGEFLKYDGAKWVSDAVATGSSAADDISTGDAAVTIATTSGNITLDAQAGDADIIFKGTDNTSDITALTLDMSEAGAASFNAAVTVGTDLTVTGGDIAYGATNSTLSVGSTAHDAAGATLSISGGATTAGTSNNQAGGSVTISGGQGKGSGAGGDIIFKTANAGGSGSTLNALATALTISDDKSATFEDNVTVKGDIIIDDGGSLKEAGGTAALTYNGSAEITTLKVAADSVAVADDHMMFFNGGATGTPKAESIADLVTAVAGTASSTGLSASSGVLSVSDLHPVGVDGANNQILTDDGDGTVTSESKLTFDGTTLLVNSDVTATTNHTTIGAHIDYDATGIIASGQTGNNVGLDVDINSDSPTMVGTVNNIGLDIDLTGGTSGTQVNVGVDVNVSGADTNIAALFNGGNVGIGTAAPAQILQVSDATPIVVVQNTTNEHTDGGAESKVLFADHAGNALGQIEGAHSGSSDDAKGQFKVSTNDGSSTQLALTIDENQDATFASHVDIAASHAYKVNGTAILSDSSGTMTLSNVDALDATTEATIESAIDTLSNLTTTGALNSGSITSGFGNVDIGSSTFDTTGAVGTGGLTVGGDLAVNGDTATFTSANANDPQIILKNTTNDAAGPTLLLENDRGANNGVDNDVCGIIDFKGTDDNSDQVSFAKIQCEVADASNGAEGGRLLLGVATHDAEMQFGLVLEDGDAEDEIDAVIGNGDNSVTTAAGYMKANNGFLVPEQKSVHIETPMLATADHTATGITTILTASESIAQGDLVYISGNGTIGKADADAVAKMPAIGLAVAAISSSAQGVILLQGMFRDDTFNFTAGNRLFASTTDGGITATVPSGSSDVAQAVGVALSDDVIYFKPDMTLVEIS